MTGDKPRRGVALLAAAGTAALVAQAVIGSALAVPLALAIGAAALAATALRDGSSRALVAGGFALGIASFLADLALGAGPPRSIPGALLCAAGAAAAAPATVTPNVWVVLACVLQAAVAVPFLAIGLVAPGWAVAVVFVLWGTALALLLRVGASRPPLALAVPPLTFAVLLGMILLGGTIFGWQA